MTGLNTLQSANYTAAAWLTLVRKGMPSLCVTHCFEHLVIHNTDLSPSPLEPNEGALLMGQLS